MTNADSGHPAAPVDPSDAAADLVAASAGLGGVRHGYAPEDANSGAAPPAPEPLATVVGGIVAAGQAAAASELALLEIRGGLAAAGARQLAIGGGVAAALVVVAIMAATFGVMLGLAPVIGAWGATLVVVAALIGLAAAAAAWARAGVARLRLALLTSPNRTPSAGEQDRQ